MAGEFRREYLLRLPLPLAQLYGRAHNAPAARARHDNTFYLFEALIKLAACPLIASYLRQIEQGEPRSPAIDRLLAQLVLPSLGQWVAILRALAKHIGQRPDAASHPLGHVWRQLDASRRDCPGILALFRRIKNGPDGEAGGDQSCSLMEVIDALVLYRNTVFGHGAGRCDSFYEQEMGPLLAPAASEFLGEGVLDLLGPRGTRLVYINEIRLLNDRQIEASLSDLVGLEAERMTPLTLSATDNTDLAPNCIAVLWPGQKSLLRLDPLLIFRGSAVTDEVLFLNRDRNGQQVEYLSYTTGQIDRDRSLAPAMARLMGRITGREIQEQELAQFAHQSLAETTSVEALFEPATRRRTMGDYEILAEVGRGGMGVVYLARQLSLGRLVALKMLPADLAGDESSLSRFRREMRALGRCEHPNIVKVLASGTLPDGQLYYAMEYIPGADLEMVWRELAGPNRLGAASTLGGTTWGRAILSASQKQRHQAGRRAAGEPTIGAVIAGADTQAADAPSTVSFAASPPSTFTPEPLPLPPLPTLPEIEDDPRGFFRRVAALVRDAAAAVQAVHDQNIIHRDIKPANLLLTPDGSRIVLMDFGLAKGQGLTHTASRSGGFLGTLRYAAPEQLAAAKITVGPQADVRALGVTLWELLSRQRLFDDADDENQMASWVLTRDLPPLRKVDSSIDPDLEAIVARATEREVDRRIQTARELGDYLQMYLDGKPLPIRRPGTSEVLWRWVREHKALVSTATAAAVSVIVVGVVSFLFVLGAWKGEQAANSQLTSTNRQLEESKSTLLKANASLEAALKEVAQANTQKDAALSNEKVARLDAQRNELQARTSQKLAESREAEAQHSLYASRMVMAHQSLEADELSRAISQLDVRNWGDDSGKSADLRGWEWQYLDGLVRARTTPLRGFSNVCWTIAWSGDGKWIASGDANGKVLLFSADHKQIAEPWARRRRWLLEVGLAYRDHKLLVANHTSFAKDPKTLPPVGSAIVAFADSTGRLVEVAGLQPAEIQALYRKSLGTAWTVQAVLPEGGARRTYTLDWRDFPPLEQGDRITAVRFSHNNKKLAVASWDDSVLVWDLDDLVFPLRITGFGNGAADVVFSPDDRLMAVAGTDETIHIFDFQNSSRIKLTGHTGDVRCVAFSEDGKQLASGGVDGTLRLWNTTTWKEEKVLALRSDTVLRVHYPPGGKHLAGITTSGKLTVWQMPERKIVYSGNPGGHGTGCIAFDSKGEVAVNGVVDGNISLMSCRQGELKDERLLHIHSAMVLSVALSPDGRYLASCAADGTLRVSDLTLTGSTEQKLTRRVDCGLRNANQLTFTPDGRQIVIGSTQRIALCEAATGRRLPAPTDLIEKYNGHMRGVTLSPNSRLAAFGTRDGSVRLVDLRGEIPVKELPADPKLRHRASIGLLAFSPDGRLLATADRERHVCIWSLPSGKLLHEIDGKGGSTRNALLFSPDSRLLVTGFGAVTFQVWDVETGELLTEIDEDRPYRAAFDPTGQRLYIGGFHSVITVWDMNTYRPIERLRGHRGPVAELAINADGTRLASAGGDGMIILWDPKRGQQLLQLGRLEGFIGGLAFRPDGRGLAAVDMLKQYLYLWDAAELSTDLKQKYDWYALFRRGIVRLQLGQWTQATSDIKSGKKYGVVDAYLPAVSGWAQFRAGSAAAGDFDLTHACGSAPKDGALWLLRDFAAEGVPTAPSKDDPRFLQGRRAALAAIEPPADHIWTFRPTSMPLDSGDWAWADKLLTDWQEAHPDAADGRFYFHRGLARAALKQYEQAEADFGLAVEKTPADVMSWLGLARVRLEKDKFKESQEACTKGIELDPKMWQLWYLRGMCQRFLEQYQPAIDDINKALELQPDLWILKADRAHLVGRKEDFSAAVSEFEELLKNTAPQETTRRLETTANYLRVADVVLGSKGVERKKAAEYYAAVAENYRRLAVDTKDGDHYRRLALCMQKQGNELREQKQFAPAAEALRQSLWAIDQANLDLTARDPSADIASIARDLSYACQDLDRFADAADATRRRIEIRRRMRLDDDDTTTRADLADSYGSLSWVLVLDRRPEESRAAALEGLKVDASQLWIRTNLAHALLFLGRYKEAEAIYLKYKDLRLSDKQTFADGVLDDFRIFREKKLEHPDLAKIEKLLAPKTPIECIR